MRRHAILVLTLSLVAPMMFATTSEAGVTGGPLFAAPQPLVEGSWNLRTALLTDVSGDSHLDVVYYENNIGAGTSTLSVLETAANGTVSSTPTQFTSSGYGYGLQEVDFDGDGDADVALTTEEGLEVFKQGPSGLASPALTSVPDWEDLPELHDLDGDGDADLLSTGSPVRYATQQPGGGFTTTTLVDSGRAIGITDFTADGKVDLLIDHGSAVVLHAQQPDGSFPRTSTFLIETAGDTFVDDFTDDGLPDILTYDGGTVTIHGWNGTSFDAPSSSSVAPSGYWAFPADMNADGRADLIVGFESPSNGFICLQQPGGGMTPTNFAPVGSQDLMDVGDVDGDGLPDLLTETYGALNLAEQLPPGSKLDTTFTMSWPYYVATVGGTTTVKGELRSDGGWLDNQEATIFRSIDGGPDESLGTVAMTGNGRYLNFTWEDDLDAGPGMYVYHAEWTGDDDHTAKTSTSASVGVTPKASNLELDAMDTTVTYGQSTTLIAHLETGAPGQPIEFTATPWGKPTETLGTAYTNAYGDAKFQVSPERWTAYGASYAGAGDWSSATAVGTTVDVRPIITGEMLDPRKEQGSFAVYTTKQVIYYAVEVAPDSTDVPIDIFLDARIKKKWKNISGPNTFYLGPGSTLLLYLPKRSLPAGYSYRFRPRLPSQVHLLGALGKPSNFKVI